MNASVDAKAQSIAKGAREEGSPGSFIGALRPFCGIACPGDFKLEEEFGADQSDQMFETSIGPISLETFET